MAVLAGPASADPGVTWAAAERARAEAAVRATGQSKASSEAALAAAREREANAARARDAALQAIAKYDADTKRVASGEGRLAKLVARRDAIVAESTKLAIEMKKTLDELAQGLFCSKCNRSKTEIERDGEPFQTHLGRVDGTPIPAAPEVIAAKRAEYLKKLADLDQRRNAADAEIAQLRTELQALEAQRAAGRAAQVQAMFKAESARYALGNSVERARANLRTATDAHAAAQRWLDRARRDEEFAQARARREAEVAKAREAWAAHQRALDDARIQNEAERRREQAKRRALEQALLDTQLAMRRRDEERRRGWSSPEVPSPSEPTPPAASAPPAPPPSRLSAPPAPPSRPSSPSPSDEPDEPEDQAPTPQQRRDSIFDSLGGPGTHSESPPEPEREDGSDGEDSAPLARRLADNARDKLGALADRARSGVRRLVDLVPGEVRDNLAQSFADQLNPQVEDDGRLVFSPSATEALKDAATSAIGDVIDRERWRIVEERTGRTFTEEEKLRAKVFEEAYKIEHPARYLPRLLDAWKKWFGVAMTDFQSELGEQPKEEK